MSFFVLITLRIFSFCKPSKATYSFNLKLKLKYLTANKTEKWAILLVGVNQKNKAANAAMRVGLV